MKRWRIGILLVAMALLALPASAGIFDNPDGVDPAATLRAPRDYTPVGGPGGDWRETNCLAKSTADACAACVYRLWAQVIISHAQATRLMIGCSEKAMGLTDCTSPRGEPWNVYDLMGLPTPRDYGNPKRVRL